MLETLLSWKVLIPAAWLCAAAFVHFRGRVRHRFQRQLTDHSTFAAPCNAVIYLASAVPRGPLLDVASVPTIHAALFALLPPGARLGAHRDPFGGSLRYHLGLITPNDDACWAAWSLPWCS